MNKPETAQFHCCSAAIENEIHKSLYLRKLNLCDGSVATLRRKKAAKQSGEVHSLYGGPDIGQWTEYITISSGPVLLYILY